MIVNIQPPHPAGSGRPLTTYILAVKRDEDGIYVPDPNKDKAEWGRTVNLGTDDPIEAIDLIEVYNASNIRAHSRSRFEHIIISFPNGERPTDQQIERIEDRLMAALGWAEHPRISALHHDTDNWHHHIAVTRIDPVTFKAEHPPFSWRRFQLEAARLEIDLGLTQEHKNLLPRERREIDERIFVDQQKFDGRALAQFAESHGREDEYRPEPKQEPTKNAETRISDDEEFSRRLMRVITAAALEHDPWEQRRILIVETGAAVDEFEGHRSLTTSLAYDLMRAIDAASRQLNPAHDLMRAVRALAGGEVIRQHTERTQQHSVGGADTIRLYRVEVAPENRVAVPEWIQQAQRANGHAEAMDRWFTADPGTLDWYRADIGGPSRTTYIDVNKALAEQYRVSNQPDVRRFSRDPENEFFVPRKLADRRVELGTTESVFEVAEPAREEKQKALEKARVLNHVPLGHRQLTAQDVARRLSPEYDRLMAKADELEKSLRKGGIRYNPLTQKHVNMQKTIDDREADIRLADDHLAERSDEMTALRHGLHRIGQLLEPHPYRRGESLTIRLGRILRDTEMTKWEKFKEHAEYTHYAYQAHLAALQGEFNVAIRAAEEVFNAEFQPGVKLHEAAERELAQRRDELKQQQKIAQHAREPLVSLDENAIQKQTRVHKRGLSL